MPKRFLDDMQRIFLKNFGKKVTQLRKLNDMTQIELAHLCGYVSVSAHSNIQGIENGKTDLPIIKFLKLADALNVSPSVLIGKDETTPEEYDAILNYFIINMIKKYYSEPMAEIIEAFNGLDDEGKNFILKKAKQIRDNKK